MRWNDLREHQRQSLSPECPAWRELQILKTVTPAVLGLPRLTALLFGSLPCPLLPLSGQIECTHFCPLLDNSGQQWILACGGLSARPISDIGCALRQCSHCRFQPL